MSAIAEGFLHSRGFSYRKTVRPTRPGTQIGGISIYQRSDSDGSPLYTATFHGGVMFLSATDYGGRARVHVRAPCPMPHTEEQLRAAILNAIEQEREQIPEGSGARALLDACERVITT